MAKPRLMLAEDHTMVAEAFVKLLAEEYDVVLDLGMPLLNGMEAGKQTA